MNKFVIESPSGAHYGNCIIGEGATEAAAWEDAFGPKPWTPYARKAARKAWSREIKEGEEQ